MMRSISLCYAAADEAFARGLSGYLETNLPVRVSCGEAMVEDGRDVLDSTELALGADIAIVLLSGASVPKALERERWMDVFVDQPKEFLTPIAFVLVGECPFPKLLRRERFFDARSGQLAALREIKRWLLHWPVSRAVSPELDDWRRAIGDQPGVVTQADAEKAMRFVEECGEDFEIVYRLDCRDLSRAGVVGEMAAAAGVSPDQLPGWAEEHRALFVIEGTAERDLPVGRTSTIFTDEPIDGALPNAASEAVRQFHGAPAVQAGWTAVRLLKPQWRLHEALEILVAMARLADSQQLKHIEREQYWVRADLDYEGLANLRVDPTIGGQLSFAFEAA